MVRIINRLIVIVMAILLLSSFNKAFAAIEWTYIGEGVNYLYITSQNGYNVCLDNSSTFYKEDTNISNKRIWYEKTYSGNLVWLDNKMNVVKTVPIKALDNTDEIVISEFLSIDEQEWFPIAKKLPYPGFTWDETLLMYEGLRTATKYNQTMPNVYKAKWSKTIVNKDSINFLDGNVKNHFIDTDGSIHILSYTRFPVDETRLIVELEVDKSRSRYRGIGTYFFLKEKTYHKNNTTPWYTQEEINRMLS